MDSLISKNIKKRANQLPTLTITTILRNRTALPAPERGLHLMNQNPYIPAGNSEITPMLDGFKNYMRSQSMAAHTQRAYISRVRKLLLFLFENGCSFNELDGASWHRELTSYISYLKNVEQASQNT